MIDGAPSKQAPQAGIYKHHPRKAGAAQQSAEQQQKRGGFVLQTKGRPHGPWAPVFPTAHACPSSTGESSAVWGPHPVSAHTARAATCAAPCVSESVI